MAFMVSQKKLGKSLARGQAASGASDVSKRWVFSDQLSLTLIQ